MNAHEDFLDEPFEVRDSWATSVTEDLEKSRRIAWIVASVSLAIAALLAIAIVIVLPLKQVEPYTLLVDRQTGNVETLAPLDEAVVAPDTALTRSFLAQYIHSREGFDGDSVQRDYRKVSLWSTGEARQRYQRQMLASNPESPLAYMPSGGTIETEIMSISSLSANSALVRFTTQRTDPGAQPQPPQYWAAVISYQFTNDAMSEDDRLLNPLGFQVTRYRRDAETMPEPVEVPTAVRPLTPRPAAESAPAQ